MLGNSCPKCSKGKVFGGLIKMNETCTHCGFKYEREPGYFTGSMALSYTLGFLIVLPSFLYLLFHDYSFPALIGIPSLEVILASPLIYRYSRLIWLHMGYKIQPIP